MLRYLLSIAQSNQCFLIEPSIGRNLAALAMLTLDKRIPFDSANFGTTSPTPLNRLYSVRGVNGTSDIKNVRVIRMHGVLTMQGDICTDGMEDLDNRLKAAYADPNIHAVVLDIHSPGGEANYLETLAETVAGSPKPIIGWVNQMAASAAYWIASATDEIILSGKGAKVGSIGSLISYVDFTKHLREQGIEMVEILATKSTEKRPYNFAEPTEEDKAKIRAGIIDPHNELFHEAVKLYRPNATEEVFNASLFMGQSGIKAGLADSFGKLEDAIIRAAELASTNHSETMSTKSTDDRKSRFDTAMAGLKSLMGFDQPEVVQESETPPVSEAVPTPTQEADVSAEVTALQAQLTTANETITQRDAHITQLQTQLDAQQTQLNALVAEVKKLGNRSSQAPAVVQSSQPVITQKAPGPLSSINEEAIRRFEAKQPQA